MLHHARGLTSKGWRVRIVTGRGDAFTPGVDVYASPLFDSTAPDVLAVKKQLDAGNVTPDFHALVERIAIELPRAVETIDAAIS